MANRVFTSGTDIVTCNHLIQSVTICLGNLERLGSLTADYVATVSGNCQVKNFCPGKRFIVKFSFGTTAVFNSMMV